MASLPDLVTENDSIKEILEDRSVSHAQALRALSEEGVDTSDRAIRRYRKNIRWDRAGLHTPPREDTLGAVASKGRFNIGPDGGDFKDVISDTPLETHNDWRHVFELFKLDPDKFVVVDDTIRCSTWQQSKRLENGDRDITQLYSYSGRFHRLAEDAISPEILEKWRHNLLEHETPWTGVKHQPLEGTYLILVADPQLGKKRTAEAVENWKRGVTNHLAIADANRHRISRIHIAFMGDESEGVCNNYTNQPHTVELNQSQQLELDFDLRVWTIKQAAELGIPLSVSSVISNHGEWTRNGSKDPVTTRNDNSSTHIARQVKKLFDELEPHGGPAIDWTIGDGAPGVTLDLSGVKCYFSHGYVEKGRGSEPEVRTKNALERQILGRTGDLGDVSLWFMAHYHHFYTREFEGRTLFGCPALEAERSSEYMQDQYGIWSPPGMLGLLIDPTRKRQWSHLNVL